MKTFRQYSIENHGAQAPSEAYIAEQEVIITNFLKSASSEVNAKASDETIAYCRLLEKPTYGLFINNVRINFVDPVREGDFYCVEDAMKHYVREIAPQDIGYCDDPRRPGFKVEVRLL